MVSYRVLAQNIQSLNIDKKLRSAFPNITKFPCDLLLHKTGQR